MGEGIVGEFGMDMYTLLCVSWIADKNLLYRTWNSAQCYMVAWTGGEFWRRMDTNVCVTMSLPSSPETIIKLFDNWL